MEYIVCKVMRSVIELAQSYIFTLLLPSPISPFFLLKSPNVSFNLIMEFDLYAYRVDLTFNACFGQF